MKQNNLVSMIGAGLLLILVFLIANNFLIKKNLESIEAMKVGGQENYQLLQDLYASDKFQQQQRTSLDQALSQLNGAVPTPTAQPQAQDQLLGQTLSQEALAEVKKDAYVLGAKDAKISRIEYSDLECPFCKKLRDAGSVKDMLKKYPDTLNYIFKAFPLGFHANAGKEAEATLCAGDLGGAEKYYNYIDEIFKRTTSGGQGFALDDLAPLAKELGLSESKFKTCLDSSKFAGRVGDENLEGSTVFGVKGTPGNVLINNETGKRVLVAGAYPTSAFQQAIEKLLK